MRSMNTVVVRKVLLGLCIALVCFTLLAVTAVAQQTTKATVKGSSTFTTQELRGEVVYVEGNNLVVRMSSGDVRTFNVPESRRFVIDGTEMTVRQLKPGTKLNATVTTTTTSVTDRTTTVGTGKVWYVAAPTVILTLPNGENRVYKAKSDYSSWSMAGKPRCLSLEEGDDGFGRKDRGGTPD